MSARWADGLPRWQPHYGDNGQVCSLAHLHPQRLTLHFDERPNQPARDIEICVGYSSHAFTKECPADQVPHAAYSKPRDPRVFCLQRYQLSLQLPAIIQGIGARNCYATKQGNYFIVDTFDLLPPNTEYWVFFNPKKDAPDTVRVYVESAYAGDPARAAVL
jgi:hypothetical protein